jgi:hypothetical protein
MFDTLLLRPSLHCNTPLHFTTLHPTTLHPTTLHYTYQHFTSSHLHFTWHHINRSHPQNYFQKSKPLHCPKELLTISLHFTFYFILFSCLLILSTLHFTSLHFTSLHFTSLFLTTTYFPSLTSLHSLPSLLHHKIVVRQAGRQSVSHSHICFVSCFTYKL